ncbi:HAD-IC family P-type ATPase, partial [Candidatus Berkelbacteria bacterium]|nr:HAD-IC family P-type ATPase [Candidatus Berkelbacteria bacterium]
MAKIIWHALSVKESLVAAKTKPTGLTEREVGHRLQRYGENKLAETKKNSPWQLFFSQFTSPLIYVLLIAALISLFLKLTIDAYVILVVILINAIIGFVQESRAEQSLEALKKFLSPKARVIRNGETKIIASNGIVLGDIIELTEGNRVPVDIRLIEVSSLKIDESTLTGESLPISKRTRVVPSDTSLGKRQNLAFAGTSVLSGRALGVTIATGDKTEFGRLATATSETVPEETPLNKNLNLLSKQLLGIVLIAVTSIALIGLVQGRDPLTMFLTAVAVAVSAIPEGLPAIMTIALAVGVQKMARKNAIIRKLAAIETLGSITMIASDKTGTLTQNELVVQKIVLPNL